MRPHRSIANHHTDLTCRKCGKVVCAACSPHRITIPREYIVRPPPGVGASPPRVSRPLYGSIHTSGEAIVEAGERVRLCNPCVPDPNTAPPESVPPPYSTGRQSNERPVGPDDRLPRFSEHVPGQHNTAYRSRPSGMPSSSNFDGSGTVTNILRNVQVSICALEVSYVYQSIANILQRWLIIRGFQWCVYRPPIATPPLDQLSMISEC